MRKRNDSGFDQAEQREVDVREQSYVPPSPTGGEMTVIGAGARLEGNLISAGSLKIEGNVKGQITAEGDVIVAPEAQVDADIRANNITIAGRYKGDVTAAGNLELATTARVEGNISCGSLIVNRGALFSGQSMMGAHSTPSEISLDEPVIEEA